MAQILRTENLKQIYKAGSSDFVLFEKLNLDIQEKEWTNIFIPHGRGKTILYKTLLGQIKPESGKVIYASRTKLDEYDKDKFLRENITCIAENPSFINNFTVNDWIKFQAQLLKISNYRKRFKSFEVMLEKENISLKIKLNDLSILQIRKLEVLISELFDTILILMDDPDLLLTSNELDNLGKFLKEINKNKAIVTISSDSYWNKLASKVIRI